MQRLFKSFFVYHHRKLCLTMVKQSSNMGTTGRKGTTESSCPFRSDGIMIRIPLVCRWLCTGHSHHNETHTHTNTHWMATATQLTPNRERVFFGRFHPACQQKRVHEASSSTRVCTFVATCRMIPSLSLVPPSSKALWWTRLCVSGRGFTTKPLERRKGPFPAYVPVSACAHPFLCVLQIKRVFTSITPDSGWTESRRVLVLRTGMGETNERL